MKRIQSLFILIILDAVFSPCFAQVSLPKLISDGMVLQRGAELPVWGWADAPGSNRNF